MKPTTNLRKPLVPEPVPRSLGYERMPDPDSYRDQQQHFIASFAVRALFLLTFLCPTKSHAQGTTNQPDTLLASQYFQKATAFRDSTYYDSSIVYFKKAAELYKKAEIWGKYIHAYNLIGNNFGILSKYDSIKHYSKRALTVGLQYLGEDHPSIAYCYDNIGYTHRFKREYDKQLDYYQKALALRLKVLGNTHPDVAKSYNCFGHYYKVKGDYDQALLHFNKALNIRLKTLSQTPPDIAKSYINIGSIYDRKGDYDKALFFYQKTLAIQLKIFGQSDLRVAQSYYYISNTYRSKMDYNNSTVYYKKAAIIYKKAGVWGKYVRTYNIIVENYLSLSKYDSAMDYLEEAIMTGLQYLREDHVEVAESYNSIGHVHGKNGNYDKELMYYQKALNIRLRLFGKSYPHVANSYNNIGTSYYIKGNYDRALIYLQKAVDIWLKTSDLPFGSWYGMVIGYGNIGNSYMKKGEYNQSLTYHQKALRMSLKRFGESHTYVARSYNNIGTSYLYEKKYGQALTYYKKSLAIRLEILGNVHHDIAQSYNTLGNFYFETKYWSKALEYYQRMLIALTINFNNPSIYVNPTIKGANSKPYLLEGLKLKANTLTIHYAEETHNLKDLQFSLETYQLATRLIDTLRYEYTSYQTRQDLNTSSLEIYEGAIRVAHQLYQVTQDTTYFHQAFALAEKSKAFLLQQALKEANALQFADIPDSLVQREKALKIDLAFYEKQAFEAEQKKDTAKITMYQNYLFERRQQFDSLIQALETNYPQYYELKYTTNTPTVAEIQQQLPDNNATLIEYFTGDSSSYAFVIQKSDFQMIELINDSTLKASVTTLRESIVQKNNNSQYVHAAHQLWQQLIQPLDTLIQKTDNQPLHLIIVPHGALHYLPFETLLTQPVDTANINFTKLPYLIHDYRISYALSSSLWLKAKQIQIITEATCLAFAPQYPGKAVPSRGSLDELRDEGLGELPGAMEEVKAMANYTDGNFFTGPEATEHNFKKYAPAASLIHLAMHGVVDTEYPENSRLVFTHSGDTIQDDSLFVYELYNMHLPSQLVVLSACNTGYGQLAKGEGLLSLARGFMYAGSPNLVMGQWEVNDHSTVTIMDRFYAGLANGLTKDAALREAKLHHLSSADENTAHPFYWASLAPMGNMGSVALKKDSNWWWILVVMGIMAVGGVVVWRVRK